MFNLPQNSLKKVPALCSYLFFLYLSFGRGVAVLVAQLRRFSGRIFQTPRYGSSIIVALQEKHLWKLWSCSLCCYIDKQNCCWAGLLKSQFCHLSVGKKNIQKSAFHRDVLKSTTWKSFPSAPSPLNAEMWNFPACDLGAEGWSSVHSHICSHLGRWGLFRDACKKPQFVPTDKIIFINESFWHINLHLCVTDLEYTNTFWQGNMPLSTRN